jgi:hypothetical protein
MDNIGGCEKEEETINKIKDETKKRLGNMKKRQQNQEKRTCSGKRV